MSAEVTLARLRRFLLVVAASLLVGTMIELWLTEHTEGTQLIPFGLGALGLGAIAALWFRPHARTVWGARVGMVGVMLGGAFGIYEHIEHNAGFYMEIHPNATPTAVLGGALSGANPLLAPGILILAAVLVWAATYYHPTTQSA